MDAFDELRGERGGAEDAESFAPSPIYAHASAPSASPREASGDFDDGVISRGFDPSPERTAPPIHARASAPPAYSASLREDSREAGDGTADWISDPPPIDRERVLAECRQVFRSHARTFWWASRFLPRRTRDDAALVYAFCRLVDDTADEGEDEEGAKLALAALSREVLRFAEPRPLISEFRRAAARLGLPLESARELIAGARSDLDPVRVADDAALVRYCYRVASTVGLMMCAVLGVRRPEALPHAVDLGVAMQLTNVARDVADDARRGRVYLPADRLRRAGVDPEALVRGDADPRAVARVVREVLELAEGYYRSADGGMRDIPARFRPAILVASRVYRAIGLRLARNRYDALAGRTVVPGREKALWCVRALAAGCRPHVLGIAPRMAHDRALHAALGGLPGANT